MKIDIYSGFLGAGKTTLIKKMIQEAYAGQRLVLIENEFGEIGIDGGFLQDAGINITEMNSGCICCSLVGDFGKALKEVQEQFHPDRILIEPSGVGKLSDVIVAVENTVADAEDMKLNSFVTVADATKVKVYMKNFGEFYNNQIETASTIILSRTDSINQFKLDTAVEMLREHNQVASIVTTPWNDLTGAQLIEAMEGKASLAAELARLEQERLEEEEDDDDCCCHHHDDDDDEDEHEHHHHHHHDHDEDEEHEHHHHHHDDELFKNLILRPGHVFTEEELQDILTRIPEDIIRVKGYVHTDKGTCYFNYVLNEYNIFKGSDRDEALVSIIGTEIDEQYFRELFND